MGHNNKFRASYTDMLSTNSKAVGIKQKVNDLY